MISKAKTNKEIYKSGYGFTKRRNCFIPATVNRCLVPALTQRAFDCRKIKNNLKIDNNLGKIIFE
jgi:hypothetical protein